MTLLGAIIPLRQALLGKVHNMQGVQKGLFMELWQLKTSFRSDSHHFINTTRTDAYSIVASVALVCIFGIAVETALAAA